MSTFVLWANDTNRVNVIANAQKFLAALSSYKSWRVEVDEQKDDRTSRQNRFLWAANQSIAKVSGHDASDIHEYLLGTYFGWKEKELPGGRVTNVPVRTTTTDEQGRRKKLDRSAFSDYADFVWAQAAKLGVMIERWEE